MMICGLLIALEPCASIYYFHQVVELCQLIQMHLIISEHIIQRMAGDDAVLHIVVDDFLYGQSFCAVYDDEIPIVDVKFVLPEVALYFTA